MTFMNSRGRRAPNESIAKLKKWNEDLAFNRTIKAIVDDKYGWARVSGMGSVGTPSELRWMESEWRQTVGADRRHTKTVIPGVFTGSPPAPSYAEENKNTLVSKIELALKKPTHNNH